LAPIKLPQILQRRTLLSSATFYRRSVAADELAVGALPDRLPEIQGDKRTVAIDLLPTNLRVTEPHPLLAWKRNADKNYGAAPAMPRALLER